MKSKLEILGMTIDSCTTSEEALARVREFLSNAQMSVIEELTTETVMLGKEDEDVRKVLESVDLAVLAEEDLVKAARSSCSRDMEEITEKDFEPGFMELLIETGQSVFLLGKKEKEVECLQEALHRNYEKLNVVGSLSTEVYALSCDAVVNEINTMDPDVIFSILPAPREEYFLLEHREKLNAKIWYGLGESSADMQDESKMKKFAKKMIRKGRFQSMLSQQEKDE